jgi:SAM-dependent methyltransferase
MYMTNIYNDEKTFHTFNLILNGRWHSGITADTYGQLKIEELLIQKSNMNSKSYVLDFGAGNGVVTCDYHILTGANIIGVTNIKKQAISANKLAQSLDISEHVKFIYCKDISTLNLGKFDIIIYTESICHIKDKDNIFKFLSEHLKKNGKIVGEDWITLNKEATKKIDSSYGTHLSTPKDYYKHLYCYYKNIKFDIIDPVWDLSTMNLAYNYLKLSYFWYNYPKLAINCPYKIDENKINPNLIMSGKHIQKNKDFKIILIVADKL